MKFLRSPIFLFLLIGAIVFAAVLLKENSNEEGDTPRYATSDKPARKAVNSFFAYGKQHDEDYVQYLAPVLEKYYLQKNISREETVPFSHDWWLKYPYEEFEIDWNNVQETDLGNGNTQFRTTMNYCKGKTANRMNCIDVFLIIKVNENNQIYYLANK